MTHFAAGFAALGSVVLTAAVAAAQPPATGDRSAASQAPPPMTNAVAKYRDLRTQYYGAMAYDFSEGGLITLANRMAAVKPDEALQWLRLNLEFYLKSARSYVAMAQIHNRRSDTGSALKNVEKALEIDPENPQAKQLAQQLKK